MITRQGDGKNNYAKTVVETPDCGLENDSPSRGRKPLGSSDITVYVFQKFRK